MLSAGNLSNYLAVKLLFRQMHAHLGDFVLILLQHITVNFMRKKMLDLKDPNFDSLWLLLSMV